MVGYPLVAGVRPVAAGFGATVSQFAADHKPGKR
jgi:hypothetical protein